jgi:hypothetical protein
LPFAAFELSLIAVVGCLDAMLAQRPELRVVTVADGAHDNWAFLGRLPRGRSAAQVVDFWDAAEYLHGGMAAVYGEASTKCRRSSKSTGTSFAKMTMACRRSSGTCAT